MSEYRIKTLEYYFENGSHIIFKKYTIDTLGIIKNLKTGKEIRYKISGDGYSRCSVYDDTNKCRYGIGIARAMVSSFIGKPPTLQHTAEHKYSKQKTNDKLDNLNWEDKSIQATNRNIPEDNKSAFVIVKNCIDRTAKEWYEYLKNNKNHLGHNYTVAMINDYARRKQHGFSYKVYDDLQEEVWKSIENSENTRGCWEISNMNRVKYITRHATNVLDSTRLCLKNGYPAIRINGKHNYIHIIVFQTFYPSEYSSMKLDEMILHNNDNKLDFHPDNLRIGTASENAKDAYYNGKYIGTSSAMMKCASYMKGVLEKEYDSQKDATKYLKSKGYLKACASEIGNALKAFNNGKIINRYDRTWQTM
jgi:hypothetical protein